MKAHSIISIGPVEVPFILLLIAGSITAVYFLGRFFVRGSKEDLHIFSNILSAPIIPFLITWKLSLLITGFQDVISNPAILLFSAGSAVNLIIGVCGGLIWALVSWFRLSPSHNVIKGLTVSAVTGIIIISVSSIILMRSPENNGPSPCYSEDAVFYLPDGTVWTPATAIGKPLVLSFWASWCPPCRAEMPMLEKTFSEEEANGFFSDAVFYAVNMSILEKQPENGIEWLKSEGLSLPLLLDRDGNANRFCGVSSLPTTIIFDRNGREIERKTGIISKRTLESALKKASRQ